MKVGNLCKIIDETVYVYGKYLDSPDWVGYLYDDVPVDILDRNVGQISAHHEPDEHFPGVYPCKTGINIYT